MSYLLSSAIQYLIALSNRSTITIVARDHLGSAYHWLGVSPHARAASISPNTELYSM
jgi:hypothetical protein